MKKTKMEAATLQPNKENILSLTQGQMGHFRGGSMTITTAETSIGIPCGEAIKQTFSPIIKKLLTQP